MSKKRVIYLTGSGNANVALVAKHKKDGSVMFRVFPIRYTAGSRQPLNPEEYDKKDALTTFRFNNVRSIDDLGVFLSKIRDQMIFDLGSVVMLDSVADGYNKNIQIMDNIVKGLHNKVDNALRMQNRRPDPREQRSSASPLKKFEVLMGNLDDLPDEVLDSALKVLGGIKDKRTNKPEKQDEAGEQQQAGSR